VILKPAFHHRTPTRTIEALPIRAYPTVLKDMAAATPAGATVATGDMDFFSAIFEVVIAARAEIAMFAIAMVGYFVLFMQKAPHNPKLQFGKKVAGKDSYEPRSPKASPDAKASPMPRKGSPSPTVHQGVDIGKQITLIRASATNKDLKGATDIFQKMEQAGVQMNCIIYNAVLDACVECRDLNAAEEWMHRMKKAQMTDVVSFNTLIKAHLQKGSFEKARRVMETMKAEGLQPNQVTFNELINAVVNKAAGQGDRRKMMWSIVEEMKSADVKPNQVTISILLKNINCYSSGAEILNTMDLVKVMEEPMDEVLLSSVVEACVRVGKPELLEAQLKQLEESAPVAINGSHTYGSLIKAYGYAKDLKSVWRCWKQMRSRHIRPTSITMGCMVEAVVNNGDTEGAYDLIHQVREDDQCQDVLNSIVYCSVLKGFTREKKVDRVWAVYEEMKIAKAELSVVTYNTLIDACARCGRMDRLDTILSDMKASGAQPNIITYSTMLKGHCQSGDVQSGFKILEQIRKDPQLKPDEIMYNSLLDGCAQNNLVTEGLRLVDEMQAEGVYPSNFTLSILVKLMNRAKRVEDAFALVQEISSKYKFQPNVHVYTNLIQACAFNQQLPKAMCTLEKMIAERVSPDGRTYSILVRASLNKGLYEQAASLLQGALGLPEAPRSLQSRCAVCPSIDYGFVNETLANLADRGHAKDLAVPLLTSIRQNNSRVRIDPATQRKVMSPCIGSKGW